MRTLVLLSLANVFMTFAWYGHLKFKSAPLWIAILASWGIAFFEYCLQVPANRWGHATFTAAQLKIMQEVITLMVFAGFSLVYLREPLRWNYLAAFGCLLAAVVFIFGVPTERSAVADRPAQRNAAAAASAHTDALGELR